jgi:hypothetical protein
MKAKSSHLERCPALRQERKLWFHLRAVSAKWMNREGNSEHAVSVDHAQAVAQTQRLQNCLSSSVDDY